MDFAKVADYTSLAKKSIKYTWYEFRELQAIKLLTVTVIPTA